MNWVRGVQRILFRSFGGLPKPFRLWVVRLVRPSWTAGSVGVLERGDGRWLFVKPVYRSGWTLPGGLIDSGESPLIALQRELAEEVGAEVEPIDSAAVVLDVGFRKIETVYRVRLARGQQPDDLAVRTPELSGLGWYFPSDPPQIEKETEAVIKLVEAQAEGGPSIRILNDEVT